MKLYLFISLLILSTQSFAQSDSAQTNPLTNEWVDTYLHTAGLNLEAVGRLQKMNMNLYLGSTLANGLLIKMFFSSADAVGLYAVGSISAILSIAIIVNQYKIAILNKEAGYVLKMSAIEFRDPRNRKRGK